MKRKSIVALAVLCLGLPPVARAADDGAKARDLAQQFDVSAQQLQEVHDQQNLDWDEIRTALLISQHSGASLGEVVRLRKTGMSFEDIASRYSLRLSEIESAGPSPKGAMPGFREAPASKRVEKKAAKLADEYAVSEDEVMRLRDRGLGWREIRHALFISERSGRPVGEIVGLKESGMDWDDIAARYNVNLKDESHRTKERAGEGGKFREAPSSERERRRQMQNDTDIRTRRDIERGEPDQSRVDQGREREQQQQSANTY